jgi:hypothetical protein
MLEDLLKLKTFVKKQYKCLSGSTKDIHKFGNKK